MAEASTKGPTNGQAEPPQPEDYFRDGSGKGQLGVDRIVTQTIRLAHDFREWVELRIQLARMEILEDLVRKAGNALIAGVLGLIGLVFLLITAAVWIGDWLGHYGWGFLIVGGVLLLTAAFFAIVRPRLYRAVYERKKPFRQEVSISRREQSVQQDKAGNTGQSSIGR